MNQQTYEFQQQMNELKTALADVVELNATTNFSGEDLAEMEDRLNIAIDAVRATRALNRAAIAQKVFLPE